MVGAHGCLASNQKMLDSNVITDKVDWTHVTHGISQKRVSHDCSQEIGVVEPPTNGDSCHSGILPQDAAFFSAVHKEVLTVSRWVG
jgi:hypothetical protein